LSAVVPRTHSDVDATRDALLAAASGLLAADGPDAVERTTGMAHLTGLLVEVERARGPQDPSSWSGLPPEAADASR